MVLGLFIGLVGVVDTPPTATCRRSSAAHSKATCWCSCAGIFWAFYVVLVDQGLNGTKLLASATGAVIMRPPIFLIPIMLILTRDYSIESTGTLAALYAGIFCTAVAFVMYSIGLKHLGQRRVRHPAGRDSVRYPIRHSLAGRDAHLGHRDRWGDDPALRHRDLKNQSEDVISKKAPQE